MDPGKEFAGGTLVFQDKFSGLLGGVIGVPEQLLNLKLMSGGKLDLKQRSCENRFELKIRGEMPFSNIINM